MSIDKASEALSYISSEDRDTWVRAGMALKCEFGDRAFSVWDSWSQLSDSYKPKDAKAVWKSFKGAGKTTIASLFYDARQSGWRDTGERHVPTPEESQVARADRQRREQEALRQVLRDNKRAASRAEEMQKTARIDVHGYFRSKQLPEAQGLILPDGALFIPMRDCHTNTLLGAQIIRWDEEEDAFTKKMIPGMRASGAAYRIGNRNAATTILCEGYVTGLSIDHAARLLRLSVSVVVCFSAGNITTVAMLLKGTKGVFADNDESKTGERKAVETGLPWVMPDTVGWDANDQHANDGIMSVSKKLLELNKMIRAVG